MIAHNHLPTCPAPYDPARRCVCDDDPLVSFPHNGIPPPAIQQTRLLDLGPAVGLAIPISLMSLKLVLYMGGY